jgi:hypothetical protein
MPDVPGSVTVNASHSHSGTASALPLTLPQDVVSHDLIKLSAAKEPSYDSTLAWPSHCRSMAM